MSALFFVLAAGLVVLALGLVAPPLFWPPRGSAAEGGGDEEARRRENIAAARRRMRELRARRGRGEISEEDFSESRAEIERALLDDLAAESESRVEKIARGRGDLEGGGDSKAYSVERPAVGGFRGIWTAAILCAALPVAAGGLYLHLGAPQAISGAAPVAAAPSMDVAIAALQGRLEADPADSAGWVLLARSLATVGRFSEAAEAYSRAGALVGGDADILAGEAGARARAAGRFTGEVLDLLGRALEADGGNATALWLSGLAAAERGEHRAAADFWRRALPGVGDAEEKEQLRRLIAQAESGLVDSEAGEGEEGAGVEDGRAGVEEGGVGVEEGGVGVEEGGVGVEVGVSLSPELSADSGDVVYVFARAVSGPRIPLAAVKRGAGELPFVLTLTDEMAMTPELKLSQFEEVDIVARISRGGDARAAPGDLVGEVKKVSVRGGGRVGVVIDRRVE